MPPKKKGRKRCKLLKKLTKSSSFEINLRVPKKKITLQDILLYNKGLSTFCPEMLFLYESLAKTIFADKSFSHLTENLSLFAN